jgi:hypothetical protein
MLKKINLKVLIPDIIIIIAIVVCSVLLRSNYYFENLALYGTPICAVDKHAYTTDKCPECGGDIIYNGQFVKRYVEDYDNATDTEQYTTVMFDEYYEDYDTYKSDLNSCLGLSIGTLSLIGIFIVLNVIFLVIHFVRKKKAKIRGN